MRRVIVLEEAAEDIEHARDFYDRQDYGVGSYFVDSIVADIEGLGMLHGIHSKHFGLHRRLSDRFPFGIYYRETPEATEVIAVLDLRRDPIWIYTELNKRNG
jgi:plasmid stabilization system protein ParE